MKTDRQIEKASKWARKCVSKQIYKAVNMYGYELVMDNFEKLLYPPNLGYFYGAASGSMDLYDINDEKFIDVFDGMCSKIKTDFILSERIREKIDYMTFSGHAEKDLFFIAGVRKGRKDVESKSNKGDCRGLIISLSRYISSYFPSKFNEDPLKLFYGDKSMIKNPVKMRYFEKEGILEKIEKLNISLKNKVDMVSEFPNEDRPEIYLLLLSFELSDTQDLLHHKMAKGSSITTSKPKRAIADMSWSEYSKLKFNQLKNKIFYGSKDEVKEDVKKYINNNWPTTKKEINKDLFGKEKLNNELRRMISKSINKLELDYKIRRYNKTNTYVPFGYTLQTE